MSNPATGTEASVKGLVDFRVRPPFGGFRQAFPHIDEPGRSDEELLERFVSEMDDAGIALSVAVGRNLPGKLDPASIFKGKVENEVLSEIKRRHPERFEVIAAVDLLDDGVVEEIRALHDQGFVGIAFEAPLYTPALHHDDAALDRAYAVCEELHMLAMITASGMIGPDLSYSDPVHVQRVAKRFPDLDIVVTHAGWPFTTQMVAVIFEEGFNEEQNVYLLPDGYLHNTLMPGREHYINGAAMFPSQYLYGSSFPNRPLQVGVDGITTVEVPGVDNFAQTCADNAHRLIARTRR